MACEDPSHSARAERVAPPPEDRSRPEAAHARGARTHRCGVRTAWTEAPATPGAVAEVAAALRGMRIAQLVVFFSPDHEPDGLARLLAVAFPGVAVAGCTMSGGIAPAGGLDRGLVAVAFPAERFRVVSTVLDGIDRLDVARTATAVRALRRTLVPPCGARDGLPGVALPGPGRGVHRFALSLIDGLTNAEETVVSAIACALDDVPLVGGSAGDDLRFRDAVVLHGGATHRNAAVLLLVETDCPVEIFKSDNFEATATKFVVTASDSEARIVHELNAEPANHL